MRDITGTMRDALLPPLPTILAQLNNIAHSLTRQELSASLSSKRRKEIGPCNQFPLTSLLPLHLSLSLYRAYVFLFLQ